jgi:hypothetical protein
VSFVRVVRTSSRAIFAYCHVRCRKSFACVARAIYTCHLPCHASSARILRVDHVCRMASARDNKLFSLMNTRVDNLNSSGPIF